MTIVTALQKEESRGKNGITNEAVIANRLAYERHRYPDLPSRQTAKQIAKSYVTDRESKLDLSKCRLRVTLFEDHTDEKQVAEAVSGDITNSNSRVGSSLDLESRMTLIGFFSLFQKLGNFDIFSMSDPHRCCDQGGWRMVIVSKYPLGNISSSSEESGSSVYPVFVLAQENGGHDQQQINLVDNVFTNFKQISLSSLEIHKDTFSFIVPQQDPEVIKAIEQHQEFIHVALYRSVDKHFSPNLIRFDYDLHDKYMECPYCAIRMMNGGGFNAPGSGLLSVSACRGGKRPRTERARNDSTTSGFSSNAGSPYNPQGQDIMDDTQQFHSLQTGSFFMSGSSAGFMQTRGRPQGGTCSSGSSSPNGNLFGFNNSSRSGFGQTLTTESANIPAFEDLDPTGDLFSTIRSEDLLPHMPTSNSLQTDGLFDRIPAFDQQLQVEGYRKDCCLTGVEDGCKNRQDCRARLVRDCQDDRDATETDDDVDESEESGSESDYDQDEDEDTTEAGTDDEQSEEEGDQPRTKHIRFPRKMTTVIDLAKATQSMTINNK